LATVQQQRRKAPIRESVTTIADDGSRVFLHPSDVSGRFTSWRRISGFLLIAIYVLLPWIPINGYPAVFLYVIDRRFHLFGLTFVAQDLWLAFFLITGVGFTLFYVTALAGRLWCGWTCPQTVFLEHVYRRVERWLEGDAQARRKLDAAPWSDPNKAVRRGLKQAIFLLISAVIAHVFLSYFVSIPELWGWMTSSPLEHWPAFVFMFLATGVLYFNFAWFREQLCIVICPYGRLQSALIDDDSLVIGYDEHRGEPRGPLKLEGTGDCIDCNRCVQVCPTGIDIRQGLQMECIGCANCIDACDTIMDKIGRPRGLVRYDSLNGLSQKKRRILRPRVFLYTGLLLAGAAVLVFSLSTLKPARVLATRMQGAPYVLSDESIRNQYNVRLQNKRNQEATFTLIGTTLPEGARTAGMDTPVIVEPLGEQVVSFVVVLDREAYAGPFSFDYTVEMTVPDGAAHQLTNDVQFAGPNPRLLDEDFLAD
jgi:cytochrome c oxidase accessory protein FixG